MINWMRPSGNPITTNEMEQTIAYAEKLGWVRVEDKQAAATETATKVKRKRRTPAQMAEARNGEGIASN